MRSRQGHWPDQPHQPRKTARQSDEDALQEAMVRIASDPELRAKLGPAGKAYITEHYRADKTVKDLHEAYGRVLRIGAGAAGGAAAGAR